MINPINTANNTPIQPQVSQQNNIKQPMPNLSDSANNVISNNIIKDANFSQMDLFGKHKVKGLGKKDKAPEVGIIETPPYNKTPIESELKKMELENPKPKNKKHAKDFDISGMLIFSVIAIGTILLISQIAKPIGFILKKIFHK